MTIAVPMYRRYYPAAEGLRPHPINRHPSLGFEDPLQGRRIDQILSTETDRINGAAARAISFDSFRLLPTRATFPLSFTASPYTLGLAVCVGEQHTHAAGLIHSVPCMNLSSCV